MQAAMQIDQEIERRIGRDLELPVLPEATQKLLAEVSAKEIDTSRVSSLIHADQALAASIVRVASSPHFARGVPVASLKQAIVRIGTKELRDLVTAMALKSRVFAGKRSKRARELFRHAAETAAFARELARTKRANVETAFLAGLLHDVGKTVVLDVLTDRSDEEVEALAASHHVEIGTRVAKAWSLPTPIVEAVAGHHRVQAEPALGAHVAIVALANALAKGEEGDPTLWVQLNIYPDEALAIRQKKEEVARFAAALG